MPRQNDPARPRRALTLDVEKYQHMLDAPHLSEAERSRLLEAIWLLVVSFVDLGFEVKAVENSCGKDALASEPRAVESADVVELEPTLPNCFNEESASDCVNAEGGAE